MERIFTLFADRNSSPSRVPPIQPNLYHQVLFYLASISLYIVFKIGRSLVLKSRFHTFSESNGCKPVPIAANPFPLPWSLGRKYEIYKASVSGDLFEGHFLRKYKKHGSTHAIVSPITGLQKGINTVEPRNMQAVLATRFGDYIRPEFRSLAAQPLLMPGLFTTDGSAWAHWRAMVKPQFTRKRFDENIANSEIHIQLLFKALESHKNGTWTTDIDLMEHLYRLTMDTATQFLFGASAETQTAALVNLGILSAGKTKSLLHGFDNKFLEAGSYVGHRIKLSNMYWVYDGFAFRGACRELHNMVGDYVTKIRQRSKARHGSEDQDVGNLVEEMEAKGVSQSDMVQQIMHLLVAGMDTSAAALGWTFSMLAAHPETYAKLRAAVLAAVGTETTRPNFSLKTLKSCTYLTWCICETLRLFPAGPINVRVAIRDTVLPVGGGADGNSPVAVRKGSRVQMGTYFMHRRQDIWGDDADEYRPERWDGRRRGWEYIPFSGGPQICVGQGYSMTQIAFAIARFALRYDRIEPSPESNNAKRSWMTVLTPGDGVKVRLRVAPENKTS